MRGLGTPEKVRSARGRNRLISVSGSESQTVEVRSGEEVTLLCSNFSSSVTQIYWFRVVKRSLPHCVSHMFESYKPATYCDGFENGKFEMSSNISTVFLKIKQVNSSDSGLYFCGYYIGYKKPLIKDAKYLEVQEVVVGITNMPSVILGGLTVFFIVISICLAVKNKKLQKAHVEEQNAQQTQHQDSDELNYAAVTFHSRTKRNYQPASEREVETNTIYSATR
ncbi:uncharacterized protein LOC131989246 [Centropristis striata]|uniref:uncharacterized protein LOC131989246 n=1 Tax=Centropristis striata TaxID=184440 RepID=UPI0027E14921|nr:uncharacterized protein LOC131989246 [Centropristis striata]